MVQHADIDHTGLTGVGGGTDPQFTTIELGHASDTTLSRVSAGVVAVEGTNIVKAGVATGSGLTMATARLLGRTTASSGAIEEITVGSGLSLAAGALTATGGGSPAFVGAKAYSTSTQAVNSTSAALTFGSEEYDTDTFHDTGSNTSRMTIPSGKDGYYLLQGGSFGSAAWTWMGFKKNGTTNIRGFGSAINAAAYGSTAAIALLAATDYVEFWVNTNASCNMGHATLPDAQSWFAITLLGT